MCCYCQIFILDKNLVSMWFTFRIWCLNMTIIAKISCSAGISFPKGHHVDYKFETYIPCCVCLLSRHNMRIYFLFAKCSKSKNDYSYSVWCTFAWYLRIRKMRNKYFCLRCKLLVSHYCECERFNQAVFAPYFGNMVGNYSYFTRINHALRLIPSIL